MPVTMKRLPWICSVLLALHSSPTYATIDFEEARKVILEDVTAIHGGVQPGKMTVLGPNAAAIATYPDAKDGPIIAAAVFGKGRIIAVPDHQLLEYADQADGGRFVQNGMLWLTGPDHAEKRILCMQQKLVEHLQLLGFKHARYCENPADELAEADVVAGWLGVNLSLKDQERIRRFVEAGGALFLAEYGIGYNWWWNKPIHEAPGNSVLQGTGIAFSDGYIHDNDLIELKPATHPPLSVNDLLDIIARDDHHDGAVAVEAAALLGGLASALPPDSRVLARLDEAIDARLQTINPTPETPVSDPLEKALLLREGIRLSKTPPEETVPHRTAQAVYGKIPESAIRLNGEVTINTDRSRWLPTGLYAPPGEVVTLSVPPEMIGKGYLVRINAHADNISPRESWERPPLVHRSFSINQETVKVANAFGGSIFIDVGNTVPGLGDVQINAAGAIQQPHFVLGKHTHDDWALRLKNGPAPYAVLEGKQIIICMPTRDLEDLRKPEAMMQWWDRVVMLEDELSAQTSLRTYPELMNIDVQISYGAAHAGYPYQAYDKHWGNPADLDNLKQNGSWGDFHELAHNHQRNHWWTFSGDGEVTVNIFSTYVLTQTAPDSSDGWAWVLSRAESLKRAKESWKAGRAYFDEPSLANRLAFYTLLAHEFGWDAFRQVFAGYEADAVNDPDALPENNDQDKIDQWCIRFSRAANRSIVPYMRDQWGIPVSDEAALMVADLPEWKID